MAGVVQRDVAIANRHPRLRFRKSQIARVIHTLDAGIAAIGVPPDRLPPGELSVVFLTDAALAALHGQFLDDPTTTDVITFEGERAFGIAGEICVSVDTAARFARDHGHAFAAELTLYLVHGWLHLAGYDDLQPAKKRAMRRAEARALQWLRQQDALPDFTLSGRRPALAARQKLAPRAKRK